MKKKLLAILVAVVLLLSTVNIVALATDQNTIPLGATIDVVGDYNTFYFTTEEAGTYVIYSKGEMRLEAYLYNNETDVCVEWVKQNSDNYKDFYILKVLGKNTTYRVEINNVALSDEVYGYSLTVDKLAPDGVLEVGTDGVIDKKESYHSFTPETSGYYYIHTIGDEDTEGELFDSKGEFKVSEDSNFGLNSNYRLEYYLNAGETYTIYTMVYGFKDEYSAGIRVVPFETAAEIEEGEAYTVTDKWDIVSFTAPKTATYRFYSVGEGEVDEYSNTSFYGKIYNSDYEVISYENEEIYSPCDFYVECEMTAGETYYLDTIMLWYDDLSPETYDVKIDEVSPITSLEIVPLDGTVAGPNEDLHCELIINPETHKSETIYWEITPERVGRIEYWDNNGASIELHSPGVAEVRAYTESGVETSYTVTCEGELDELELNEPKSAYIEYADIIHAYSFTADEEGYYGFLSKGDELDLKVALYEQGETEPFKTETSKGDGDNFNVQFYNDVPGTEYIVEVSVERDEEDYNEYSGNYQIMAYVPTEEVQGVKLSVGDSYTVYTDGVPYTFSASLVPETANLSALDFAVWQLSGDEIGYQTIYGRNFVQYGFYNAGVATLTVSIEDGEFTDSCVITAKEAGYNDIALNEVKTIYSDSHESEGWFEFTAPEDGEYTIYSTGEADPYIHIYDAEFGDYMDEDDDSGYSYNFLYTTELTAGEVLYFRAYSWSEGEYNVSVCKKHAPESVTIVENKDYDYAVYGLFSAVMGNGGATYDNYDQFEWEISDTSIAEFSYYYDDGTVELYYIKRGVATLTVTTPEGYTDSYTFCAGVADANNDDRFDVLDLVSMKNILLNSNPDDYYFTDFDENGEVNALDYALVRKMLFASF